MSLSWRVTSYFALATAAVFSLFGWMVYGSIEEMSAKDDSEELFIVVEAVDSLLIEHLDDSHSVNFHQRMADVLVGHHSVSLRLVGPHGAPIFQSSFPNIPARALSTDAEPTIEELEFDGTHYRVLSRSLSHGNASYQVSVAVPIDHQLQFLAEFRLILMTMILSGIVLMSLLGLVAVRKGHAPLRDIVERMRQINADELRLRVRESEVPKELLDLVVTFNGLLERVDGAIQRLQDFNADIAHEFRTPIANLMTETEVSLSKARTADEYRETLYSNVEEYERMAQMISDMLFLAKADFGPQLHEVEAVRLTDEIESLLAYYEGWAAERGVTLEQFGSATVDVDRGMIRRSLSNLISNAIKCSERGGVVRVDVKEPRRGWVEISVENDGEDIPSKYWPKMFERFYRVPNRDKPADKGNGLGLSIVKAVATAYKGEVSVRSNDGKTCFTLSLPISARAGNAV